MKTTTTTIWAAKLNAARKARPMSTILLALLINVALSALLFLLLLTRFSWEDADWWLKAISAEFATVVFFTGLLALYTGGVVNDKLASTVASLGKETAEARTKQANAERALLELQEHLKPRHFTDEQRARFTELMRDGSLELLLSRGAEGRLRPINILYTENSEDARDFAAQIADALKYGALGRFEVTFNKLDSQREIDRFREFGQAPRGLVIEVRTKRVGAYTLKAGEEETSDPPEARLLERALAEANFSVGWRRMSAGHFPEEPPIELIVGTKPNPRFEEEQRRKHEKLMEEGRRQLEELRREREKRMGEGQRKP